MASVSNRRYDQMDNMTSRDAQTRRNVLNNNAEPNTQNRKPENDRSTTGFSDVRMRHKPNNSRAPPKPGSRGRRNGDDKAREGSAGGRSDRREEEHLLSVHDNPFIKEFGLESAMHHETNDILDADLRTNDSDNVTEPEPVEEYHVNSGFVNKLRSRFEFDNQAPAKLTRAKRSASVENLLGHGSRSSSGRSRLGSTNRSSADDSKIVARSQPDFNKYGQLGIKAIERPKSKELSGKIDLKKFGTLGVKTSERPKSNEVVLNKRNDKPIIGKPKKVDIPQTNNFLRSNRPSTPTRPSSDIDTNKHRKHSELDNAPLPEHHDWTVAPDLQKLGRDNLVIIEAVPPPPRQEENESGLDDTDTRQVRALQVKNNENELPKANTVSAFRSMFENSKKLASAVHSWLPRSPTPRGSVSETNSPRLSSGGSLPASPLVSKTDDNVFKYSSTGKPTSTSIDNKPSKLLDSYKKEERSSEKSDVIDVNSQRSLSDKSLPDVEAEPADTATISAQFGITLTDHAKRVTIDKATRDKHDKKPKPTIDRKQKPSIDRTRKPSGDRTQKPSVDRTQRPSIDKVQKPSIDRTQRPSIDKVQKPSLPVDTTNKSTNQEARQTLERSDSSQDNQVSHPFKEVFDSKSVAPLPKPKRPTAVYPSPRGKVPKDTLALKHEQDRKSPVQSSPKDENKTLISVSPTPDVNIKLSPRDVVSATNDYNVEEDKKMIENLLKDEFIIEEPNIKPSARRSGKTSPRQTKVFDSNDMKKLNREPPTALSPTSNTAFSFRLPSPTMRTESPVSAEPDTTVEMVDAAEAPTNMDTTPAPVVVPPVKPSRRRPEQKRNNIVAATNHEKNDKLSQIPREATFEKNHTSEQGKPTSEKVENGDAEAPISGRSSFLTNRLNKVNNAQESDTQPVKTTSVHLSNGVSPSPVPRKRQAAERPNEQVAINDTNINKDAAPPLPSSPEPKLPEPSFDNIIKRKKKAAQPSTKCVFDSSKIANKRKDPPKRKPPRKTLEELNDNIIPEPRVPRLDLSCITDDPPVDTEYQEGYIPTEIKPCPYHFEGAGVKLANNPLKKRRTNKVKLVFDDHAITTFEYETEEEALENYLREHPDERKDAEEQELQERINSMPDSPDDLKRDSPRVPSPDGSMKSNTVIGNSSTGALLSYKSKMAVDFQFGVPQESDDAHFDEPDRDLEQNHVNDNSMQLLPADENDLDAFSAEASKSDMLF